MPSEGVKAWIEKMAPEERREIARKPVLTRWAKHKKDKQRSTEELVGLVIQASRRSG
jgi:hypothetical protein